MRLLALAALAAFVLAGCSMKNEELHDKNRDDTGKAMQKATAGATDTP